MMLPIGLRFSTETLNFRVSGSGSILDQRKKSLSSTKAFDKVARKEARVFADDVVADVASSSIFVVGQKVTFGSTVDTQMVDSDFGNRQLPDLKEFNQH